MKIIESVHLPKQDRGPTLNGTKLHGCLFSISSGLNRFGSHLSGCSYISLFKCKPMIHNIALVPAGKISPSTIKQGTCTVHLNLNVISILQTADLFYS